MTLDEFDALFDIFQVSAFHLETHQTYAVSEEDERLHAFREGLPRPERSVRTSPWLRRIALTTAEGKQWSRVHVIREPLSEYLRYELIGYTISTATRVPVVILVAAMCIYLALVAIVTVVVSLHPDADRREDARKVLDLLLTASRPDRRR